MRLELIGRPKGDEGKHVVLIRYVSNLVSGDGGVGHLGGSRVTLCLVPAEHNKVTVYLENVIES